MLTKNGRKIFGAFIKPAFTNSATSINLTLVNHKGETVKGLPNGTSSTGSTIYYISSNGTFEYKSSKCNMEPLTLKDFGVSGGSAEGGIALCVGSDDTEETIDDYYIAPTGLTGHDLSYTVMSNNHMLQLSMPCSNQTEQDIIVKEVGIALLYIRGDSTASALLEKQSFLLYRQVLREPVIIKPDEMFTFTIVLR